METEQVVAFVIQVADAGRLRVRVVGNLVMIFAQRSDPAELILRTGLNSNERNPPCRLPDRESPAAPVSRGRDRSGSVYARVIGEALSVAADVELIVG